MYQYNTALFGGSGPSGFGSVKTSVSVSGSFSVNSNSIASTGFGGFQSPDKSGQ